MSTIWEVLDTVTGELVALKRLRSPSDGKRASRMRALFEREYLTLAQLAHPRVVEVHDYGVDREGPWYTMELLAGGDLNGLAPVEWKRACAWIRDICSALSLLHARQLVHRDVSPRNIRCTGNGLAKLIDFGAMTPMGPCRHVVGTPPICPPEVANRGDLDARSDLFSLGCTFYHALTGRHAYPARDFAQLPMAWNNETFRPFVSRPKPDLAAASTVRASRH